MDRGFRREIQLSLRRRPLPFGIILVMTQSGTSADSHDIQSLAPIVVRKGSEWVERHGMIVDVAAIVGLSLGFLCSALATCGIYRGLTSHSLKILERF